MLSRTLLNTLRKEILAGRKFGGFGGFCQRKENLFFYKYLYDQNAKNLKTSIVMTLSLALVFLFEEETFKSCDQCVANGFLSKS